LSESVAANLVRCYGDRALDVLDVAQQEGLTGPLVPGFEPIEAEALYCARSEMATHLSDVLGRRTRLSLIDPAAGIGEGSRAVTTMAAEFGWSEREVKRQVNAHRSEVENERGLSLHPAPQTKDASGLVAGAG
jgi:glycerol-3-phosphate dehydrogenase